MLIETNIQDKYKSKYQCDRCKKELTRKDKVGISVQLPTNKNKKLCDLCLRCYKMLVNGIKKGEHK